MEDFLKAASAALICVIVCLVLAKKDKDFSLIVTLAVCCMAAGVAMRYLEPLITFFRRLQTLGGMDTQMLQILLKSAGIGLLTEIVCMVCQDADNAALAKTMQILSTSVILWMSIPLLESLLQLLGKVLGEA